MIKIVNGNLLDAEEEYICHQCNCCSTFSKGLSYHIFNKFIYANTYQYRTKDPSTRSTPGTIDILGDANKKIVNMYSQFYPGPSKYQNDTSEKRKQWFINCLEEIKKININLIAIPYNIGCGLAGENWEEYFSILENFSKNNNISITLYKL